VPLDELAMRYESNYERPALNRLLKVFQARNAVLPSFFQRLGTLPAAVRLFVTTNYDPFIEKGLAARNPSVIIREAGLENVPESRPAVYKIHGDAGSPGECVITTGDYDAWTPEGQLLPSVLTTFFLQRPVVAIGYRAADPHFRQLLLRVNRSIQGRGGEPRTFYVITPEPSIDAFAAYTNHSYNLVLVDCTGDEFVEWLTNRLGEVRRKREAQELERLIDSRDVAEARARQYALINARRDPATGLRPPTPEEARVEAEAYGALADALEAGGRARLRERQRDSRGAAIRRAGEPTGADQPQSVRGGTRREDRLPGNPVPGD
jgi:hypothetical protein